MNVEHIKNFTLKISFIFIFFMYLVIYKIFPDFSTINRISILFINIILFLVFFKSFFLNRLKIDYLFFTLALYLFLSSIIYYFITGKLIEDYLREILTSVLPIFFYFIGKNLKKDLMLSSLYLLILIFLLHGIFDILLINERKYVNFHGAFSVIGFGYYAQFIFVLVLFLQPRFRLILLLIAFTLSLLSLQRAAYVGIFNGFILYLFCLIYKKNTIAFIKIILVVFLLILISTLFLPLNDLLLISNEIEGLNLDELTAGARGEFANITNYTDIFNIIFGEGFGKYSSSNSLAQLTLDDVAYYRIFNELGVIGTIVFFLPFLAVLIYSFKNRNFFGIYFVLNTLLAFYVNRIVFIFPLGVLVYFVLGLIVNNNFKIYFNYNKKG